MTWEIVVGIIVLVGFAVSIGTLLFKLSSILPRLDECEKRLINREVRIHDPERNEVKK